jgi:hypothetical protein
MNIPQEIEAVALLGWRVYPASRHSKAACFKGATSAATCDLDVIAGWQAEYGPCNWRVVMAGSGIWSLDVDAPGQDHEADGISALKALVLKHGALPPRPTTRSGGGGYALFFSHTDEKITGATGTPAKGIDPRRGNLTVTLPPSIHVTTRCPYIWAPGMAPWEVNPPTAPDWLLNLLKPPPEPEYRHPIANTTDAARRVLYRAAGVIMNAGPGQRNEALNRRSYIIGRMIGAGILAEQEAVDALYGAARATGLSHHEIKATLKSSLSSGMRQPLERHA